MSFYIFAFLIQTYKDNLRCMKGLFAIVFCLFVTVSVWAQQSGIDGMLTWTFDDGTFTVSGAGNMEDHTFDYNNTAWALHTKSSKKVVISTGVTSIGNHAFFECPSLLSVTISGTVTSIGKESFFGCRSLFTITIPESVTSIGEDAFSYCESLERVNYKAKNGIIINGMPGWTNITVLNIGENVESLPDKVFSGCLDLAKINIKASIPPTIQSTTFEDVNRAIPVYVPATSFTAYNSHALWKQFNIQAQEESQFTWTLDNEDALTVTGTGDMDDYFEEFYPWYSSRPLIQQVVISKGITSVGNYAFSDCSNLTSVQISESVTSIGVGAFADCSALTEMSINAVIPPEIHATTFENVSRTISIYVPKESVEEYIFHDLWWEFDIKSQSITGIAKNVSQDISIFIQEGQIVIKGIKQPQIVLYDISGRIIISGNMNRIDVPQRGVYLINILGAMLKVLV